MAEKKLRFRRDAPSERKEEEEVAKKVVLDYATVKTAVQTIREFEKEYNISMLNPKGLSEASAILKKYEQQDKLQRFVEEKISQQIAPLNAKIDRLVDMMTPQAQQPEEDEPETEPDILKGAPDYVRKNQRPQQ